MFVPLFFAVICRAALAFLQVNFSEYPLMECTKYISQEHFTPGRPLVIVLPLAEEDSTSEEVGYLIEKLHKSNRWPIRVLNTAYEIDRSMRNEINPHGSYIILASGACREFNKFTEHIYKQLAGLTKSDSWNPKARLVVPVMNACPLYNTTNLSRVIFNKLWLHRVTNIVVLFSESKHQATKVIQQHETSSAQDTQCNLHTWLPYENSERCNPTAGTMPVKILSARNLNDVRNGGIFRGNVGKNLNRCPIKVLLRAAYPYVVSQLIWNKTSGTYSGELSGWDIELVKVIAETLNMTIIPLPAHYPNSHKITEYIEMEVIKAGLEDGKADVAIGGVSRLENLPYNLEATRGYYNVKTAWCTPCSIKHPRLSRILGIFSADLWISFILSVVLAVIVMVCISKYGRKFYLPEFEAYRNINSITDNIIAVLLGMSATTQPRTRPLRVFFFSWVCFSVAFNTVFQAYLTSFLIDTGYEEPIKTIDQMLNSGKKFGFSKEDQHLFEDSTDSVSKTILKGMVFCPDFATCVHWARTYRNISTLCTDLNTKYAKSIGLSTDENNRPLLCDLDDGDVVNLEIVMAVLKENPLVEHINDVIDRIVEAGIFMQWTNRFLDEAKISTKTTLSYTLADKYLNISIRHMQSAIYLLIFGCALAFLSFFIEIAWYKLISKRRLSHVNT